MKEFIADLIGNALVMALGIAAVAFLLKKYAYIAGKKAEKLDIEVNVQGGGVMGQAYATHTAIAKGLVAYLNDEALENMYKQYDRSLLVSDPRRKMPKKPLGRGARKKRQKSYR